MSAPEYRTTRIVEATVEEVFEAWTDPAVLGRWFGPGDTTADIEQLDLRPGGGYRFAMTGSEGGRLVVGGTYREVEPPRRLAFSWRWEEGGPDDIESVVTVELEPAGEATELTLTHGGFPDPEVAAPYGRGWDASLSNLDRLFA